MASRILEEFKKIADNKIASQYLEKTAAAHGLKFRRIDEVKTVATRPRLDEQVWKEMRGELTEIDTDTLGLAVGDHRSQSLAEALAVLVAVKLCGVLVRRRQDSAPR